MEDLEQQLLFLQLQLKIAKENKREAGREMKENAKKVKRPTTDYWSGYINATKQILQEVNKQ